MANEYLTYSAIGDREDLTDVIANIDPTDTPFFTTFEKKEANGTKHEWQTQALATAAVNAQPEAKTFTPLAAVPTARLYNYTQINTKDISVSGTQEAVSKAGRDSEFDYQRGLRMAELGRDTEVSLATGTRAAGSGGAPTRTLGGVDSWITTNVSANGGTPRALTQTLVDNTLALAWERGGKPRSIYARGTQLIAIAGFAGGGNFRRVTNNVQEVVNSVTTYVSPFGEHKVIPHHFIAVGTVYLLDDDLWKVAQLRPVFEKKPGDLGDTFIGMIISELTLEAQAEYGNAKITDLS